MRDSPLFSVALGLAEPREVVDVQFDSARRRWRTARLVFGVRIDLNWGRGPVALGNARGQRCGSAVRSDRRCALTETPASTQTRKPETTLSTAVGLQDFRSTSKAGECRDKCSRLRRFARLTIAGSRSTHQPTPARPDVSASACA